MRIDLHTHSRASDGTQSPRELVHAAAAAGLDVLAITDHDTSAGWDEAVAAAAETGVELVRGMEISTRYAGRGVHLLAYLPDPTYGPLDAELTKVLEGRRSRVPAMLERLRALGVEIGQADVDRAAHGTAATGRPHVADALVTLGVVGDRTEAFDRFLGAGRPANVDRYAAPLLDTIRFIAEAGGVSVVAHPWGRSLHRLSTADLERFRDAGLAGLEVDHQDHDAAARAELRGIAADLDLVVTGSSDHHGAGKLDHELGVNTTAPDQYHRLVELAATAAAATRRTTPKVIK